MTGWSRRPRPTRRCRSAAGSRPAPCRAPWSDPTGGATHWHPADRLPGWAVAREASAEIGGLTFYRLETGHPPARPAAPALVVAA